VVERGGEDLDILIAQQRALESTLAEYTCWLNRQPVPARQRRFIREEAARFLRWRHTDFTSFGSSTGTAAWCYLQWSRREHISQASVLRTWAALEMFLEYAASSPVASTGKAGAGTPA
jgi:hypothetical protein